jgi:hypothetical protein
MRRLLVIATVLAATVLMVAGPAAPSGLGSAEVAGQLSVLFNNDPWDDLAIGVPGENASAGVVNVLNGSDVGLSATSLVRQQGNPEPGDRFGAALAKGYFDDDSFLDLAVGAPRESIGTVSAAGAVVVFYGSATGLTGAGQVLQQANPEVGDFFGTALTAGDFNNDEFFDLAVGAPGEDVGRAGNAGSVTVFNGSSTGLSSTPSYSRFQSNPEKATASGRRWTRRSTTPAAAGTWQWAPRARRSRPSARRARSVCSTAGPEAWAPRSS